MRRLDGGEEIRWRSRGRNRSDPAPAKLKAAPFSIFGKRAFWCTIGTKGLRDLSSGPLVFRINGQDEALSN